MAGPTFEEWIFHLGLQQIHDPHFDKPVYRKPSFGELELSAESKRKSVSAYATLATGGNPALETCADAWA
ncbi:hypothetical protein N2599_37330 (plasmid) [Rhizobium sullae]|uniref:Uncharacterized protein n=1 Tax=Rhizobium sullae TaxID=50338 RepID=A0ABY5XYA8_RHISU|nr:hypothetical protein [Rhizobium sullae]UWU19619.1 hypothetical protein N2599_37330 [Rhizobium sullae]